MTLAVLAEGVRTTNQVDTVSSTCRTVDSIELRVHKGRTLKYPIDQIDNIFFVKLTSNAWYVCLVIVLIDDKEPKRFIMRATMAADLVNHVNRQKCTGVLSYEEKVRFFDECQGSPSY